MEPFSFFYAKDRFISVDNLVEIFANALWGKYQQIGKRESEYIKKTSSAGGSNNAHKIQPWQKL
jgi:hypothetical protein